MTWRIPLVKGHFFFFRIYDFRHPHALDPYTEQKISLQSQIVTTIRADPI